MTKSRKIDIKNEQKTRILQGEDNEIITHKQKISYYKWFLLRKSTVGNLCFKFHWGDPVISFCLS